MALKKTPFRVDPIDMNAEQFIEFANDFAKASAKTSSDEIQQAFEDNLDYLARPGDQVVVIRKPWPIGHWGTVVAFREFNPCYFRVEVEIEGKLLQIPASALARQVGSPDCEKAELKYIIQRFGITPRTHVISHAQGSGFSVSFLDGTDNFFMLIV